MPLSNGVYVAPTFVNDQSPALDAAEMNAMARAVAGALEYDRAQSLTTAQKQQVANNAGLVSIHPQTLTESQQQQVRDNLNAAAPSETALVTVATTDWTGSEAPYTATVACSIVNAGSKLIVQPGGTPTAEQYEAISTSGIFCVGKGNGTITLNAYGGIPAVDIQVAVIVVG